MTTSSNSVYPLPVSEPLVVKEQDIEDAFIAKLRSLKYTYRPDIRDRAALDLNFRQKFEALNRIALPGQIFYSTQTPVCPWLLSKNKNADAKCGFRDRMKVGNQLVLDAGINSVIIYSNLKV
jgi:hypothetical protein